jgi:ribosomal protein S4
MKKCVIGILIGGVLSQIPSYLLKFEQEISLNKYKEVKEAIERNPDSVRVYTSDGLQNDEYNLIMKNDNRIETAKVKEDVINLIERQK